MGTFGNTFGETLGSTNIRSIFNPLTDGDVILYTQTRSGNKMIATKGSDVTILTPAIYLSGTTSYMRGQTATLGIIGGSAWDVTFKFKLDDKTRRDCLFFNGGNSNGTRGITIMPFNGDLILYSSDGTAYTTATVPCNFQSLTDYVLRFQWNGLTGGTMTITVNGTVYTTTTNKGWSGLSSSSVTDLGNYANTYYFKGVYKSVVGILGGASFNLYPTGLNSGEYDLSIPGTKTTFSRSNGSTVYVNDATYWLDYGYSIQKQKGTNTIFYFPNDLSGNLVDMGPLLSGGATTLAWIRGSTTSHNLSPSKLRFTESFFDRSNTTIWNTIARTGFYDAANVKNFDISEINLMTLRSFLNNGYKGKFFPMADGNTIDDKLYLQELILCAADKKGGSELPILRFTRDIRRTQKRPDDSYYTDSDGYLQLYLYGDLGGDAVGNFNKFQTLINTSSDAILAGNKYEVFAVSQPLLIPSNKNVTINCEVRIKKASQSNLTAPVTAGDIVYNVSSVFGFNVGEWVAISDLSLPAQGSQTRNVASCGKIVAVGLSTITLDAGSRYAIPATGKMMHLQSVILIEDQVNVGIYGNGIINANKDYQYDVEPVNLFPAEEFRTACGIAVFESQNVKIIGGADKLTIKNAVLHGITLGSLSVRVDGCEIANVLSTDNHDKNILCVSTDNAYIHDVECTNALFEDGITFYLNNKTFNVQDVKISGNARIGLNVVSNQICNGIINNVVISDSMSITSSNVSVSNVSFTEGYILVTDAYLYGNNNTFNNIAISNVVSATNIVNILGNVTGNTFNNLTINDCTGIGVLVDKMVSGTLYPQNTMFNNGGIYNHTGTHTSVLGTSTVTFNNFANA